MRKYQTLLSKFSISAFALIFATNFAVPSHALSSSESDLEAGKLAMMHDGASEEEMEAMEGSETMEAQMEMMEESSMEEEQEMGFKVMTAMLSGDNVYPTPVETNAGGVAVAILSENNTLMVYGSFNALSSPLRDYETDPVDPPNPAITSAVHLHIGTPEENGSFIHALSVTTSEDGLSGLFTGTYQLSDEEVEALGEGNLYIDIHTTENRGGELRGVIRE
ncbi:CHRD domain containing protein [Cyanobacterium stanieri PCC 7202]|uniref:CHRD domain containing protein n=1 Tax=Cyanobacterium stanieri (strain ATCC 29140 / PCC 7202) TaxID=292563 RepID=K9YMD6_CYASC|nr:CHRD domain containing protein [Cyanobacterium stanieri PCC 7202]